MANATVTGPVRERQINDVFYVSAGGGFPTIQRAIDYVRVFNGGVGQIVIGHGFGHSENIPSLTGGAVGIYLTDLRDEATQNWLWNGTNYIPWPSINLAGFLASGPAPTSPNPAAIASTTLGFDPAGGGGNGNGQLTVTANNGDPMPAISITGQPSDGTPAHTYIRTDKDTAGNNRVRMPQALELTADPLGPANYNLWVGEDHATQAQGLSVTAQPDINAIALQGQTVDVGFDQIIALNPSGGGVTVNGSLIRTFANTTGLNTADLITISATKVQGITLIGTNRRSILTIANDGTITGATFDTLQLNSLNVTGSVTTNDMTLLVSNTFGLMFGVLDGTKRRVLFGVSNQGVVMSPGSTTAPNTNITITGPYGTVAPPDAPFVPPGFTTALNHVTITGQSLSVGADSPPITNVQPYNNKKFSSGVNAITKTGTNTLVPLVADTFETVSNAFADHTVRDVLLQGLSHDILMSGSGISGQPYSAICGPTDFGGAGSPSFQELVSQITVGKALAPSTYAHRGIFLLHGETDAQNNNTNYLANLVTWQSDIQNASKTATGRTAIVPMFMAQCCFPLTGIAQTLAAIQHPDTHVMVGAEYNIPHVTLAQIAAGASDLHLGTYGERIAGEYFEKAYKTVILQGKRWLPLYPTRFVVAGKSIIVTFNTPVAPLVLDTSLVADPGNFGFRYSQVTVPSSGVVITGVAVTAPTQVTISLSGAPTIGTGTLSYGAWINGSFPPPANGNGHPGPLGGPRGCLRDSDPTIAYYPDSVGVFTPLYNYCVLFNASI